MIWVLEFVLLTFLVLGFVLYATKLSKNKTDRQIGDRINAYITTIRRTRQPEHLNEMSDPELLDILRAAAHKLEKHQSRRIALIMLGSVLTLGVAIMMAVQIGIQGFAVAGLVGALATYGTDQMVVRNMLQWFERQALDPTRLEVNYGL